MAREDLKGAKKSKNDEFYTQLSDISKEVSHYRSQFKDKVVLCNCDDPYESNFFKYFCMNFNFLGLKKLIATCYSGSTVANTEINLFEDVKFEHGYKLEITEMKDVNGDGAIDLGDVEYLLKKKKLVPMPLEGNGDFTSEECIKLLDEADIVCTNPPFSLFREYIDLIERHNKKFLIIGNTNALTYKETFKLIKENKVRTGYTNFNVGMYFIVPFYFDKYHKVNEDGKKLVRVSTSCWFTNLEVEKHKETMILYKNFTPDEYPKFENFDAINVNKVNEIPCDYNGLMGVPITFLDKFNPEQFEVIGLGISNSGIEIGVQPYKPEHRKYRKEVQKRGAVDGDLYMMNGEEVVVPYARVIIKKKVNHDK